MVRDQFQSLAYLEPNRGEILVTTGVVYGPSFHSDKKEIRQFMNDVILQVLTTLQD